MGNLWWNEGELSILVGRADFGNLLTGYRRSVKNITYHPDFYKIPQQMGNQDFPPRHDLAIIEVAVPLEFYDYVQPAKLPRMNQTSTAKSGRWTDWGGLEDSSLLKRVEMPILTPEECEHFYGKYKITENMFCAAYVDPVSGDALEVASLFGKGGPLICQLEDENGQPQDVICGISSLTPIYNHLCYGPDEDEAKSSRHAGPFVGYPTAMVDVTKYVDWISETINKS